MAARFPIPQYQGNVSSGGCLLCLKGHGRQRAHTRHSDVERRNIHLSSCPRAREVACTDTAAKKHQHQQLLWSSHARRWEGSRRQAWSTGRLTVSLSAVTPRLEVLLSAARLSQVFTPFLVAQTCSCSKLTDLRFGCCKAD